MANPSVGRTERWIENLRNNLSIRDWLYLVLFAAVVFGTSVGMFLSLLGTELILGSVIFLLTLMASHEFLERVGPLAKIEILLGRLAFPSVGHSLRDRRGMPSVEEFARGAKDIFLTGRSLAMSAGSRNFLLNRLEDGASLRLVLLTPHENDPCVLGAARGINTTLGGLLADVNSAISHFQYLKQERGKHSYTGSIEWRYASSTPTLSILMVDGDQPHGKMQVELVPHGTDARDRPHFVLTRARETKWFDLFKQACDRIWEDAKPCS